MTLGFALTGLGLSREGVAAEPAVRALEGSINVHPLGPALAVPKADSAMVAPPFSGQEAVGIGSMPRILARNETRLRGRGSPAANAKKLPIQHLARCAMIITITFHTNKVLVLVVIDTSMVNDLTAFVVVCASSFLVEQATTTSATRSVAGVPVHGKLEI
jgi:hypothetical protein